MKTQDGDYPFHPLADDYPLMPAYELGRLEEGMREDGFDPRFPIVLYQGRVLDGRNRQLAAKAAEVEPLYTTFEGTERQAKRFVQIANEERRHLAADWLKRRREERIGRVMAARQEGQSTRAIAEAEGVSEVQVRRDLETAELSGQNGVENISVAPGGATESVVPQAKPPETVIGKSGRSYPAKRTPKCEKCTRHKLNLPDCPACKGIREAPAREKAEKEAEKQAKADEKARQKAEREANAARVKADREAEKARKAAEKAAREEEARRKKEEAAAAKEAERKALEAVEEENGSTDGWGIPIREHAKAAFEARPLFDELLSLLRKADLLYSRVAEHEGGAYLRRPGISVNARDRWKHNGIKTAILNVADCRPTYAVCPYAYSKAKNYKHGDDCTLCRGLNWTRPLGKNEIAAELVEAAKEANKDV